MTGLCPECSDESQRWLDYRAVRPIQLIVIGSPLRAALDAHKLRGETWRKTVRGQRQLIAESCTGREHKQPLNQPIPCREQLRIGWALPADVEAAVNNQLDPLIEGAPRG